jgi:hypothetical protein
MRRDDFSVAEPMVQVIKLAIRVGVAGIRMVQGANRLRRQVTG